MLSWCRYSLPVCYAGFVNNRIEDVEFRSKCFVLRTLLLLKLPKTIAFVETQSYVREMGISKKLACINFVYWPKCSFSNTIVFIKCSILVLITRVCFARI